MLTYLGNIVVATDVLHKDILFDTFIVRSIAVFDVNLGI